MDQQAGGTHLPHDVATRAGCCAAPQAAESVLLIDARGSPPEGPDCDAALAVKAFMLGWRRLVHYNTRGTRVPRRRLRPADRRPAHRLLRQPGDYLGSGMDGLEIHVHGNAQDQFGQITKRGKLVVHGDVGQTFLYGAKGGEVYVLGNAAGRPLINAVGRPRVVINGTCLDFLAESFMAGDPRNGRRVRHRQRREVRRRQGRWFPCTTPYPGSNLFSLASGGAIYVRDPHSTPGRPAAQRRGLPPAGRRRLEDDPALPRREPAAVRHPHRAATC